jgi:hypothetical protein
MKVNFHANKIISNVKITCHGTISNLKDFNLLLNNNFIFKSIPINYLPVRDKKYKVADYCDNKNPCDDQYNYYKNLNFSKRYRTQLRSSFKKINGDLELPTYSSKNNKTKCRCGCILSGSFKIGH